MVIWYRNLILAWKESYGYILKSELVQFTDEFCMQGVRES